MSSFLVSTMVQASEHQIIDVLGVSPKGQYVAVEEYGYRSQNHTYYVSVKVMNVWTKEYVGEKVEVIQPAHRPHYLDKARAEAKTQAHEQLKRFNISS